MIRRVRITEAGAHSGMLAEGCAWATGSVRPRHRDSIVWRAYLVGVLAEEVSDGARGVSHSGVRAFVRCLRHGTGPRPVWPGERCSSNAA